MNSNHFHYRNTILHILLRTFLILDCGTDPDTSKKEMGATRKVVVLMLLMLCCMSFSICSSIRYGFLTDAFTRRGVPGSVYGPMETSCFLGFILMYLTGITEAVMKRTNNRNIFMIFLVPLALSSLATGFVYYIPNTSVMISVSFCLRICQGALFYSNSIYPVDFAHAHFEDIFDFVNGLTMIGNFGGHGIAECIGCIIYEHYGYLAPFIFSSIITLVVSSAAFFVIPKSKAYLATQDEAADRHTGSIYPSETKSNRSRLSKLLAIPMIATMLINVNYGVFQVNTLLVS